MVDILMPRNQGLVTPHANVSLEKRAEQFAKKQLQSYALVSVDSNGRVVVDFDMRELNSKNIGAIGQGVYMLYEQLAKMQEDVLRSENQLGMDFGKMVGHFDETAEVFSKMKS
jgi:hypothetical protein